MRSHSATMTVTVLTLRMTKLSTNCCCCKCKPSALVKPRAHTVHFFRYLGYPQVILLPSRIVAFLMAM